MTTFEVESQANWKITISFESSSIYYHISTWKWSNGICQKKRNSINTSFWRGFLSRIIFSPYSTSSMPNDHIQRYKSWLIPNLQSSLQQSSKFKIYYSIWIEYTSNFIIFEAIKYELWYLICSGWWSF